MSVVDGATSVKRRRWRPMRVDPTPGHVLVDLIGRRDILRELLVNRGIVESLAVKEFLESDGKLLDPFLLPDMDMAVDRVLKALDRGERIAIYADYDIDGLTGGAVLYEALRALGADVIVHIPHRLNDGYGVHADAVEGLAAKGAKVMITVDCGISASAEIELARHLGIDVIVTDHHIVPAGPMPALATIDPHRADCAYPFPSLAGVGVAFKLVQALAEHRPEFDANDLLDFVALGTVGDVVALLGENRLLVRRGLERLNQTKRPGILALCQVAGLVLGKITAEVIAYGLAPRLNAASRVGDPIREGFPLLITKDPDEAQILAQRLQELNAERRRLTANAVEHARIIAEQEASSPMVFVADSICSIGIAGLVAQRLAEEYQRPAFILEPVGDQYRGSARGVNGIDIAAALGECRDLLIRYGGHAGAAGFAVHAKDFEAFREQLHRVMSRTAPLELEPELVFETELLPGDLRPSLYDDLTELAPHGFGNPEPLFLSRSLTILEQRVVGERHLRLRVSDGFSEWPAIGFGLGFACGQLGNRIDAIYRFNQSEWQGRTTLELHLADLRPSL